VILLTQTLTQLEEKRDMRGALTYKESVIQLSPPVQTSQGKGALAMPADKRTIGLTLGATLVALGAADALYTSRGVTTQDFNAAVKCLKQLDGPDAKPCSLSEQQSLVVAFPYALDRMRSVGETMIGLGIAGSTLMLTRRKPG
jgi:hypothetical protein